MLLTHALVRFAEQFYCTKKPCTSARHAFGDETRTHELDLSWHAKMAVFRIPKTLPGILNAAVPSGHILMPVMRDIERLYYEVRAEYSSSIHTRTWYIPYRFDVYTMPDTPVFSRFC